MRWLALLLLAGCPDFESPEVIACGSAGDCPADLRCEPVVDRCVPDDTPAVAGIEVDPWPATLEAGPAPRLTARLVAADGERVHVSGGSFVARVAPRGAPASPAAAADGLLSVDGLALAQMGAGQRVEVAGGGLVGASPAFEVVPSKAVIREVAPPMPAAGCVEVAYTLVQAQGLPVDVLVEVDPDGDGPEDFQPATQAASQHAGVDGLPGLADGRRVSFTWDASFDLHAANRDARLRFTPRVGEVAGEPVTAAVRVEQAAAVEIVDFPPADLLRVLDVDRDGWPDELSATGSQLSVRFRGPDPAETMVEVGEKIRDLVLADVDVDGRADLAIATGGGGLRTFRQVARRQLEAGVVLDESPELREVASGDLDRDGDDDLFAVSSGGNVLAFEHLPPGWAQADQLVSDDNPGLAVGIYDFAAPDLLLGSELSDLRIYHEPFVNPPVPQVLPLRGRPVLAEIDRDLRPDLALHGGRLVVANQHETVDLGLPAQAAAVVDLSGDGRADLVAATDNHVQLLERVGDASLAFAAPAKLVPLAGVIRLDVVDHDRDGRADLIAHTVGRAYWLRNLTPRRCTPRVGGPLVNPAVTGGPRRLLVDIDRDGKLDAIQGGSEVSAALGLGDGRFAPAQPLAPGGEIGELRAGDLDGDGATDLLHLVPGSAALVILRNQAASPGTFSVDTLATGGEARVFDVGDLDGDGLLEVILLGPDIFELRRGDLAVGEALLPGQEVCRGTCDVRLADLDLDGRLEVVTVDGAILRVLRLDAAGQLVELTQVPVTATRVEGIADVVGDPGPDVLLVEDGERLNAWTLAGESLIDSWSIHWPEDLIFAGVTLADLVGLAFADTTCLIRPRDEPSGSELQLKGCFAGFSAEATADLDGDGVVDLVGRVSGRLAALTTARSDGHLDVGRRMNGLGLGSGIVELGDLDRNGLADAVALDDEASAYRVAYQPATDPGGLLVSEEPLPEHVPMVVVDLDRDRCDDVLTPGGAQLALISSCGSEFFPRCIGASASAPLGVGDVDGDGWPDVVFSEAGRVAMYTSPGRTKLCAAAVELVADGRFRAGMRLALADLDLDGRLDLLSLGAEPLVSLQMSDGTLATPVSAQGEAWAVADLDRDGFPDLLTTAGGAVRWHAGLGDGSFAAAQILFAQDVAQELLVADLDGDGWLDLLADSTVYLQASPLAFAPAYTLEGEAARSRLVDFDRDGRLDVLRVAASTGLVLYRGR